MEINMYFSKLLILFNYCSYLCYATLNNVQSVFQDIILTRDHRFRPVVDQNKTLNVYIGLDLISLVDVDEVRQTLSINVLLTLVWRDEFRTWNPSDYGGLTSVTPDPLDIWRPRLFISNTVADRDMFEDDYAPLTVFYNGTTIWHPGGILHTSCPMKLARYPFDKHNCKITFSTGESPDEMKFITDKQNISLDFYEANGEWDLSVSKVEVGGMQRNWENMPLLSFSFQIQRKVSFAILCILMPVIVISSLPALVFITPVDTGERVTFSITVFLSLTFSTEQLSGNFPKSSESLPLLVIYLACLLMYSSIAVCINLFVLLKQSKHVHGPNIRKEKHNLAQECICNRSLTQNFVSLSNKYQLQLPILSRRTSTVQLENPTTRDQKGNNSIYTDIKAFSYGQDQTDQGRFGDFFTRTRTNYSSADGSQTKDSSNKRVSYLKLPSVLGNINQFDTVLFLGFSSLWLVLAMAFLILQVGDYLPQ